MPENAKITTLIENGTIVYPKTVKEAVYGLEEELNKKEVTIGSTPDEDAVLWIEPDGDVTTPIYAPNVAQVGQTIVVSAVDENGRPTAWEAVNMPQSGGGGDEWELIFDVITSQDLTIFEQNVDKNGNHFNLKKAIIIYKITPVDGNTSSFGLGVGVDSINKGWGFSPFGAKSAPKSGETAATGTMILEKIGNHVYPVHQTVSHNNTNVYLTQDAVFPSTAWSLEETTLASKTTGDINYITFGSYAKCIGVGSRFILWGVRE